MTKIEFGTSGWRAIIAEDFTFENVEIMAQSISNYIIDEKMENMGIVIGYDNRFLSPEFANACARVFSANRIKVYLSDEAIPTPAVSFYINKYKSAGSVNITASHNPGLYNGIKYNLPNGGPADKDTIKAIMKHVVEIDQTKRINRVYNDELIEKFNPKKEYINELLKFIDIEVIKNSNLRIVSNPLFGAGIGYLEDILTDLDCDVVVVNEYRDAYFGGIMPDVSKRNMEDMIPIMKECNADLGIATDGDADRFGIIDKDGNFISPNEVLYLLMHYLITTRGWKTCVGRSVATTYMLDRLGEKFGIEVIETPVGFKYFVDLFLEKEAFLCGEESGGLSIKGHVPEKDGILACLLVVEMVAKLGKTPTEIIEDLKAEFGYLYNDRRDIHCTQKQKEDILGKLNSLSPKTIADKQVIKVISIDGLKFVMEDGSWVLVRASGTEPLFRIYGEGNSKGQLEEILDQVCSLLGLK